MTTTTKTLPIVSVVTLPNEVEARLRADGALLIPITDATVYASDVAEAFYARALDLEKNANDNQRDAGTPAEKLAEAAAIARALITAGDLGDWAPEAQADILRLSTCDQWATLDD